MKKKQKFKLPASMSPDYVTETFFRACRLVESLSEESGLPANEVMRKLVGLIFSNIVAGEKLMHEPAQMLRFLEEYKDEKGLEMISSVFEYFSANLKLGQVFTPWEIVFSMVGMCISGLKERKEWKDPNYPSEWLEPACGCGRFVVGAHVELEKLNRPHVIYAIDIDAEAIRACAVNCYLFKIPAILIHGDFMGGEIYTLWCCKDGKIFEAPELIPAVYKHLEFDSLDRAEIVKKVKKKKS